MSTNCDIVTDNNADTEGKDLDRWSLFAQMFRSGERVWKDCAISKLEYLKDDPHNLDSHYWIDKAIAEVKNNCIDTVMIIHEHDIKHSLCDNCDPWVSDKELLAVYPKSGLHTKPVRRVIGIDPGDSFGDYSVPYNPLDYSLTNQE